MEVKYLDEIAEKDCTVYQVWDHRGRDLIYLYDKKKKVFYHNVFWTELEFNSDDSWLARRLFDIGYKSVSMGRNRKKLTRIHSGEFFDKIIKFDSTIKKLT